MRLGAYVKNYEEKGKDLSNALERFFLFKK